MKITNSDCTFPDEHPKTKGEERAINTMADIKCAACGMLWEPDEDALESIRIRGICQVPETVVTCPSCKKRSAICPRGGNDVSTDEEKGAVAISAPKKGFVIAALDE